MVPASSNDPKFPAEHSVRPGNYAVYLHESHTNSMNVPCGCVTPSNHLKLPQDAADIPGRLYAMAMTNSEDLCYSLQLQTEALNK